MAPPPTASIVMLTSSPFAALPAWARVALCCAPGAAGRVAANGCAGTLWPFVPLFLFSLGFDCGRSGCWSADTGYPQLGHAVARLDTSRPQSGQFTSAMVSEFTRLRGGTESQSDAPAIRCERQPQ